jgi:hypothetical protein
MSSKVSVDWRPDHTHTVIALSSRLFITGHRLFHSCWSNNGRDHFENGDFHRRCAELRVTSSAFVRDLQILVRKTGLISFSMPDGHILIIFPSSENDSTMFPKSSWLHPFDSRLQIYQNTRRISHHASVRSPHSLTPHGERHCPTSMTGKGTWRL